MYQLTISDLSYNLNTVMFVCDLLDSRKWGGMSDAPASLHDIMSMVADFLGVDLDDPTEMASYGICDIEEFRPAMTTMREIVECFDRAITIPKSEREKAIFRRRGMEI